MVDKVYLAGEREATNSSRAIASRGSTQAARQWTKHVKRRLFSFYYHGGHPGTRSKVNRVTGLSAAITDALELGWELALDSGGYTFSDKGMPLPVAAYTDYCLGQPAIFTLVAALDRIGTTDLSAAESYENYRYSRLRGVDVKPVYHVLEPVKWLERLIDEGEAYGQYLLLGGMVPLKTAPLRERLDFLFTKYLCHPDGTPKLKVHGFGMTDLELIFRYPWYSVDSTSWLQTGINGAVLLLSGPRELIKFYFVDQKTTELNYVTDSEAERCVIDNYLRQYGLIGTKLSAKNGYVFRDVVNAATFQGLEGLGSKRFEYITT